MAAETAESSDWIKIGTWDMIGVETVDDLIANTYSPGGDKDRLRHFMTLPAAIPMPAGLRAEVEAFLREAFLREG